MADLLPDLSSDNEEEELVGNKDDDDEEQEEVGIEGDFEFGGILGEDGTQLRPLDLEIIQIKQTKNLTSAAALDAQNPQQQSMVPRLEIRDIIQAKRQSIIQKASSSSSNNKKKYPKDEEDDNDNDETSHSSSRTSDDESSEERSNVEDTSENEEDDVVVKEEDILKTRVEKSNVNNDEDDEERRKEAAFYDQTEDVCHVTTEIEVFPQFPLSRPILRGIAAMGYQTPTKIQSMVIPLALQYRDICGSAVTGSGKTAAFGIPILQKVLSRVSNRNIQAVILAPTRELAAQCHSMLEALAQFTEIKIACIVGGTKNINLQAAQLRHADIVVATPGRLLDHVTNTQGVNLDAVETLVLDEADRLLDLGFQDEILELVNSCPKNRQTMLFSATFSTKVDDLIKLSLQHPVRVHVSEMPTSNNKKNKAMEVAPRLEQEFVRVRNEENREAILIALLTRTFRKSVIVFFDTKVTAHRLMIICGLLGINCSELHGNLTQPQRLQALDDFRKNTVDVLLATDVAARGIDISHVQTVINFEMPSQIENYIHRIGRTARAGKGGRSCTLIGEGRRILMKEIIKDTEAKEHKATVIRSRNIPAGVVTHFAAKIQLLESHIEEVLQAEAVARMDRIAEMEAIRAQNLIEHSDEIQARPKREWFASTQQKKLTKEAVAEKQRMIAEKVGTGVHRMTRKKRRAREAMQMENDDNDSDDEAEGNDVPASKKRNVSNIKAEVRKQKRMQAEKDKELAEKSIRDIDLEKERRSQQKKKKKASSSGDAIGDGSLFDEDRVSFAKKKVQKEKETSSTPPKSSFHFRGYDPDKKLGKRKGHKAFKSKSKFKRR